MYKDAFRLGYRGWRGEEDQEVEDVFSVSLALALSVTSLLFVVIIF
jgi:hypothetical protein